MSAGFGEAAGKAAGNAIVTAAQNAGDAAMTQAKQAATDMAASNVVLRGLQTGKDAVSLAAKAIAFSFAAITTLAAGYLAGIGIDFIPFVDKYSIVSSILLYTSITAALASPLLVIPRTALAVHDHRRQALREHLSKLDGQRIELEKRREKNIVDEREVKARLKADSMTEHDRAWWEKLPLVGRPEPTPRLKPEVEQDQAQEELLKRAIEEDDDKAKALMAKRQQTLDELTRLNSNRWFGSLRVLCYLFYAIVGATIFLNVLPALAVAYFTAAMLALYVLAKRSSLEIVAPIISVHLLAFGLLLGLESYNLPANATLRIGDEDYPARVLMTTSTGYVAIGALTKKSTERQLSFVPRESVARISASGPSAIANWYRSLPRFTVQALAGAKTK